MGRPRLPIVMHLGADEIAHRYRACRSGVEKTHWQILWLMTRREDAPAPATVARLVGLTPTWVRTVLKRWNTEGAAGLADRRPATNGGKPKLSAERQAALSEALRSRPSDGGPWTGPKVVSYVRERWGVIACNETGLRWLTRLRSGSQGRPHAVPEVSTADGRRHTQPSVPTMIRAAHER